MLERIVSDLCDRGETVELIEPPSAEEVTPSLEAAVSRGFQRVLIAGGDGLVHRALPALIGTQAEVGLLPIGTGNDFARAMGCRTVTRRSCSAAVSDALGPVRSVDVLQTPAGPVASVATAGFSGRVNATANGYRLPLGAQKYTLATLSEASRLEPMPLRLEMDSGIVEREVSFVAVANTRFFGGGMAICPAADPTDGWLDVTVVDPLGAARLLFFLPLVFSGRHVGHPAVTTYRTRALTAQAGEAFWGDGEPLGFSSGEFRVLPKALQLAIGGAPDRSRTGGNPRGRPLGRRPSPGGQSDGSPRRSDFR